MNIAQSMYHNISSLWSRDRIEIVLEAFPANLSDTVALYLGYLRCSLGKGSIEKLRVDYRVVGSEAFDSRVVPTGVLPGPIVVKP